MNNIFKKPLISEKSYYQASNHIYTFIVDKEATKDEIINQCEALFGVDVVSVKTANYLGKIKKTKKGIGKRSDYKKALIKVKSGQKIDLFETEEEKNDKEKSKK